MGSRFGLSVFVLNQRMASVLSSASVLGRALCNSDFATTDNINAQLAVSYAAVTVLSAKANPDARMAALTSTDDIARVLELAVDYLQTPEAGLTCTQLSATDRALLLPALALGPHYINTELGKIPSSTTVNDATASGNICSFKGLELTASATELSSVASTLMATTTADSVVAFLAASPADRAAVAAATATKMTELLSTTEKLEKAAKDANISAQKVVKDLGAAGVQSVHCSTSDTYLLAAYTAPNDTVPYGFRSHFEGLDYDALLANTTRLGAFKDDVRAAVARAAKLVVANVEIVNLTRGSVIVDFVLHVPADWTAAQVNAFANAITQDPTSVWDAAFIAAYPEITTVTVTSTSDLPPVAKPLLTKEQQIGIGVGVGAGVPVLAGIVALLALRKRRRMVVEPRNAMGGDQLA
ncbi:MAG: hypothetical protein J3K34DRAFT_400112 [Monoraphidium minutum]|nr:MAG: hypothetical protein J3K34DRAFT_400112 [Monoraphidium minutum]